MGPPVKKPHLLKTTFASFGISFASFVMRGPPRPDKRPRFQDFKTMSGDVWRKNGDQWWDREPGGKANVVIFEDVDPL